MIYLKKLLPVFMAVILCTVPVFSNASTAPGVLSVGLENRPKTLDPRYATDAAGMRMTQHLIFSSLVQHGYDLKIEPQIAESWDIEGGTTYIFHLKKGIRFHDGSPLTARDVKFTFEHLMDPATGSPFAGTYKVIESIEAIDDYTVKFILKKPVASFLTSLIMAILPEHQITGGADFSKAPVGSGPFKFKHQSPGEIVFEKNTDYFEGAPAMDRIVFKVIKDDNTRFLKLKKGDLDMVSNALPARRLESFNKGSLAKKYQVLESPGLAYNYLCLNLKDKTLGDRRVRKAIAHGIDVGQIIKFRLGGHAIPSRSLLSPANWYHNPKAAIYPCDPEKAKKLLDSAGFTDPDGDGPGTRLTIELKTSNNPQVVGIARILKAQLQRVGIGVNIKSYEWGTFYGDIKSGNFQAASMRWVGVTEPDFYFSIFHSEQVPPSGRNRGHYNNKQIDGLSEQGRITLDQDKRKAIYDEIQSIAGEELPYISLWHTSNVSVVSRRLEGYRQHPLGGYLSFREIKMAGKK